MAALTTQDRRDLRLLIHLLQAISRILRWLVTESNLVSQDLRREFLEVHRSAVSPRLASAVDTLERLKDSERGEWVRLRDAGLTGAPLRLKVRVWRSVVSAFAAQNASVPRKPAPPGFLGRVLQPLLKVMNSILGSFTAAFPLLELVKEYKDGVEVVVEEHHRSSPPPARIFDI